MKLILIRHAKTKQDSSDGSDFSRKLKPRGFEQCKIMKEFLGSLTLNKPLVLCSSASRAIQTFDNGIKGSVDAEVVFTKDIYLPFMKDILATINAMEHTGDIIVVGHNYSLSEFLYYLTGENITMKTASLAIIDFEVENSSLISGQSGRLLQYAEMV